MQTWIPPQASFSVEDVIRISGIKRTRLYAEIKAGRLKVRKCGSRTLILQEDLGNWLKSLPEPEIVSVPDYSN